MVSIVFVDNKFWGELLAYYNLPPFVVTEFYGFLTRLAVFDKLREVTGAIGRDLNEFSVKVGTA